MMADTLTLNWDRERVEDAFMQAGVVLIGVRDSKYHAVVDGKGYVNVLDLTAHDLKELLALSDSSCQVYLQAGVASADKSIKTTPKLATEFILQYLLTKDWEYSIKPVYEDALERAINEQDERLRRLDF